MPSNGPGPRSTTHRLGRPSRNLGYQGMPDRGRNRSSCRWPGTSTAVRLGRPSPGSERCPREYVAVPEVAHAGERGRGFGRGRDRHLVPRTSPSGPCPRGGTVNTCDPALVLLQQELADVGTMAEGLNRRAEEVLETLGRILSFDSGWLAVRDPERRRHVPLATTGTAEPLRRYFESPAADAELEHLGLNSAQCPVLASELPVPLPEISAWGEYLLPAGFHGGVAGPLFASTGRHVGFVSLLAEDPARPSPADREILAAVTRVIADDLDRTQEIATIARIVGTAEAGVVLTRGGDALPLPGLPDDRLLAPDSPILAAAAQELSAGGPYTAFLAPVAGPDGGRLRRVTALDCSLPDLDHLAAAVLLSSPGQLRRLTPLDLRVVGHLVAGTTQVPALAAALDLDPGTTTEALRRAQVALDAPGLTAAATRALRTGLRFPPTLDRPAPTGRR